VQVEMREIGGKVLIDFFSNDDLHKLLDIFERGVPETALAPESPAVEQAALEEALAPESAAPEPSDDDLYNIKHFSI
jgi:hypothetical protein